MKAEYTPGLLDACAAIRRMFHQLGWRSHIDQFDAAVDAIDETVGSTHGLWLMLEAEPLRSEAQNPTMPGVGRALCRLYWAIAPENHPGFACAWTATERASEARGAAYHADWVSSRVVGAIPHACGAIQEMELRDWRERNPA